MARKPAPARQQARRSDEFVVSSRMIRWAIGFVGAALAAIVAWFTIWDRIDSHWRLETVQKAQDAKQKAELDALRDKTDSDMKQLAKRAEVGRAWVLWSVMDSKATNATQFSEICKSLKRPGEVCAKYEQDAVQFRQEASDAKRAAQDAAKEK